MTTDHNEAMRLAEWHDEQAHGWRHAAELKSADHPEPVKSSLLRKAAFHESAAALIRKQAERIAELGAAQAGIIQAITDPENQPSQYGTVTLDYLSDKLKEWERRYAKRDEQADKAAAERDTLRAELETERMRLVACGVVAMANTAESAAKARDMHPDYLCASVRDVAAAVDREMALRAEVERLRNAMTVPTIEPNSQNWAGMDGAIAFHLIERHADSWADAGRMMSEWREANDTARKATQ